MSLDARELVDEHSSKIGIALLEIAAFYDRLDRTDRRIAVT